MSNQLTEKEYQRIFKKRKKRFKNFSGWVVYFAALFLCFYAFLNYPALTKRFISIPHSVKAIATKSINPSVETTKEPAKPTARVYISDLANNAIAIPALNILAPVQWNIATTDMYKKLETGTVHLDGFAKPNEIGNTFIFGHSSNYLWAPGEYKTIFAPLPQIKTGQDIVINYNNEQFLYKVTSTKIVKPKDVSVLASTDKPTLTLMTCYPVGTALSRFIVQADLVEGLVYDSGSTNPRLDYLPAIR